LCKPVAQWVEHMFLRRKEVGWILPGEWDLRVLYGCNNIFFFFFFWAIPKNQTQQLLFYFGFVVTIKWKAMITAQQLCTTTYIGVIHVSGWILPMWVSCAQPIVQLTLLLNERPEKKKKEKSIASHATVHGTPIPFRVFYLCICFV